MSVTAENIKAAIREHFSGRYKGDKDLFDNHNSSDGLLRQRPIFLLLARGAGIQDEEIAQSLGYTGGSRAVAGAYARAKAIYGENDTFSDNLRQIAGKLGIHVPYAEIIKAGDWRAEPELPLDFQI